jgi:glutaredoxin
MKRFLCLLIVALFLIPMGVTAATNKNPELSHKIESFFKSSLQKRGLQGVEIKATVLEKIKGLDGFYFVRIDIDDKPRNKKVNQFIITDGERLLPDVINLQKGTSLLKDLTFKYETYNVDTKGLTIIKGNKSAKNVIIKVGDFECPFCQKAHDDLEKLLKGKKDYVVYQMHLPLKFHKQAILRAKIFEAGKMMGKNFENELYHVKGLSDDKLVEKFAKKSGNPAKFKKLLESKEIMNKIQSQSQRASALGLSATPVLFINGKKIVGYNPPMMKKAIDSFK